MSERTDEYMSHDALPVWLGIGFPFLFASLWAFVLFMLSFAGGWRALASAYPVTTHSDGEQFHFRSARLRAVNYSSSLHFRATPSGLLVSVFLPFRPFHPSFLVPWSDIRAENVRRLFRQQVRLRFRLVPGATLDLSRHLARELSRASRGGFSVPAETQ